MSFNLYRYTIHSVCNINFDLYDKILKVCVTFLFFKPKHNLRKYKQFLRNCSLHRKNRSPIWNTAAWPTCKSNHGQEMSPEIIVKSYIYIFGLCLRLAIKVKKWHLVTKYDETKMWNLCLPSLETVLRLSIAGRLSKVGNERWEKRGTQKNLILLILCILKCFKKCLARIYIISDVFEIIHE